MSSNKFSDQPIEESIVSKDCDEIEEIKKYYEDHVVKRLEIFNKHKNLILKISRLEYSAYSHNGYIDEVILPTINALLNFKILSDEAIAYYFGKTIHSFQFSIDEVFREVDYVLYRRFL